MTNSGLCANEYRVHGSPGSGKTTYLTRKVQAAVERGYKGDLLVASFTKAAAAELAGRDLHLSNHQVGTLHAHCFAGLGQPTIAETRIKEFNEENPEFKLSPKTDANTNEQDSHMPAGETIIDGLFAEYNLYRNRKTDRRMWRQSVLNFAEKWENWKLETGYYDFTDLIEHGRTDFIYPPNQAKVGIFDEVQDFTPLQMDLIRDWARQMKYVMIAGDCEQCLYLFSGATPDTFLYPEIPEERETLLAKSYRCPKAIQDYSTRFLNKMTKKKDKPLEPRAEGGEVNKVPHNYKMGDSLAKLMDYEINYAGLNEQGEKRSVMFIAACGYMLTPLKKKLREKGIPFHNPYRKTEGSWNPLSTSPTGTPNRILAFLEPRGPWMGGYQLWTAQQLSLWLDIIKSKDVLQTNAKKKLDSFVKSEQDYDPDKLLDLYTEIFLSESLEQAAQLDPSWLRGHATAEKYRRMEFPMQILHKQGQRKLRETPQLTIGSIHSTKGGECDTVFLVPDLSTRNFQDYSQGYGSEQFEAIMRLFYVGCTRARERLNILRPANGRQYVREAIG